MLKCIDSNVCFAGDLFENLGCGLCPDEGFKAEAGRYYLYVSLACPAPCTDLALAYAEAPGHGVHHSQGRKLDPSAPHRVSVAPAKPFRVAANV